MSKKTHWEDAGQGFLVAWKCQETDESSTKRKRPFLSSGKNAAFCRVL